ncbi:alpha/beta fold hydrolase [Microbacterium sp. NPDC058342]|uniref:alpha/beta fold hydrolase n=1 Tax=Microbacterium sp. NPDC058342 TaxID=3346454 RepID=UPI00364B739B
MVKLDRECDRPGAAIRFVDPGGEGQPIVFTHGAGMDHTVFLVQAHAAQLAGHRPILWDLRGHGASLLKPGARFTACDALDDLGALLDACGGERPILVGHSLGGNLSQAFVRRHPDRVRGLIAVDSTWNTGPLTRAERFGLRLADPMLGMVPARRLPRLMAKASAVRPDAVAEIEAVLSRMPARSFLDVWRATASLVDPDPAYRIPVPLGLIRGAADRTGNISSAMPRWARAEGVRERVIDGAGHVVTLDAPEETAAALLSIVEEMTA